MLNKILLGSAQRIVLDPSTGREHVVICRDLNKGTWDVWEQVDGYGEKHSRVNGSITLENASVVFDGYLSDFRRKSLFDQYAEAHEGVKEGTHVITTKKGFTSVIKNPMWGTPTDTTCPVHGCEMRRRKAGRGGFFLGCRFFISRDCKITMSSDGTKTYGYDESSLSEAV
jgi:hypothetical protein